MVTRRKTAWNKNQRREVLKTFGRFLSILAIVSLGVGLFSGLKVTKNAMIDTADIYLREYALYDEKLMTTIGVDETEVEAIAAMDGVLAAEGSVSMDVIAQLDEGTYVLAAHSITTEVNRLKITTGRMPVADNECLGDARMFPKSAVGTKLTISDQNDQDTQDAFTYHTYTIVGLTDSTTYLNMERGTTKLASGKITAFVYIPAGGFSTEYFTELYVKLSDANGKIFSEAYDDAVAKMEDPLKEKMELLADARFADIVRDAQAEIDDGEQEYQDGLSEYRTEKADAEQELADAAAELADAKTQIDNGWYSIRQNESRLAAAQQQYDEGLAAYNQGYADYEAARADAFAQLDASQQTLDGQRATLTAALDAATLAGDTDQIAYLQGQLAALDIAQGQLDAQRQTATQLFDGTLAQLNANKAQLDAAKQQIDDGNAGIVQGKRALHDAEQKYEDGYAEYLDGKAEAEQKFADAERELADARKELDDAQAELDKQNPPSVYLLNRETNAGYVNFENDSSIVNGISKVFPVFFFLVAALVTMTTMTRMVEEQRTQIGTLKAMGYGGGAIAWKYISYAGGAALVGGMIGFFGGSWLFPWVIWQAYGMLYGFAPIIYTLDWSLFALAMSVTLLSSVGVTVLTCRAELRLMPAELMRPKAPKEGKRVFLERIPFLWKRLGFMVKISLRNVFRYTKRLIMMVLGIGGCTALLIAGFGIRDSIANIASDQFDNIMTYDFAVVFDEPKNEAQQAQFQEDTKEILSQSVFVSTDTISAYTKEGYKTVNVIATGDPNISSLIDMHNHGQQLAYPEDGTVAISEKLARIAGVSVGDNIRVKVDDTRQVSLKVSAIFENFVYHYMLMTPATYETTFDKPAEYEAVLADSAIADQHSVAATIMDEHGAANVSVTTDIEQRVNDMMKSLDLVIFVIIFCAGALAFVVLFNLSNINITERIREIATIKVLGFYAPEVGAYVFRENLVLTLLGSIAGIPLGIWLHSFVMGQLSFDMVSFQTIIKPLSYILSVAMTFVFAFGVDLVMRPRLSKINMVESLKAVE
ncbi:MAG: ABC transporter permease [Firmicutes bacterium HGW-Firmicutes-9]|jgi:putative ABC transport system permease protein|nr:MAG: ABC transporter permease [Firmicutes bacterium HGW-Firmicutes-9]